MDQKTCNEFVGVAKNRTYIVSKDMDEAASFDSYGVMENLMSSVSAIALCSYLKPTDIVSIIGDPTLDMCEIYYNGYVSLVEKGYLETYHCISDVSKCEVALPLRINHENEYVMQLLIPFKKGVISRKYIEDCLCCSINWSSL